LIKTNLVSVCVLPRSATVRPTHPWEPSRGKCSHL